MTDASLNRSMNSALRHYRSMFSLPSLKKVLLANVLISAVLVGFSIFILQPSVQGLAVSFAFGFSLFILTFAADLTVNKKILKNDPIYSLRRTSALSLVSWALWAFFILLGVAFGGFFGFSWWVRFCLLGFAAVVTFRAIVFFATSSTVMWRRIVSVLLQPTFCIALFLVFWGTLASVNLAQTLPFVVVSAIAGCAFVLLFLYFIDHLGKRAVGMQSMPLFRAFLLNWVVGLNEPLERILDTLGEKADIEVSLLKFDSSKPKAALVVPLVHPGPFKNIGSSLLPSLLKQDFEKELGYVTSVPLGILGHELDLTSQDQNHKVIEHTISSAKFNTTDNLATPFVKATEGPATASCQIFGSTALLSFTLAPKTTEDLPQELGQYVEGEARRLGLRLAVVVNAHNSLNETMDTGQFIDALRVAASKCLQKAVALQAKPFRVGAATVYPEEFTLKDGMGTGGITAFVVQVENQKTAYVVIDGNNMIPHLREKIISELSSDGFDESEVFTTDTHAVSAVVTGRRGYHPVGEVMDHTLLISLIKEMAKKAEANLEYAEAGALRFIVPQVTVIGEAKLKSLTTLVDQAIQKAKQTIIPIFGLEGLVLLLLLLLF